MTKRVVPMARAGIGMSAAVRFGDMVAVSGQVALDEAGTLVGDGDCAAQARQCFANVARILEQAGAGLGDVVSVTAFLADASDAARYLEVRAATFPEDPPATTTVVAALLDPRFLVEVQVLASVAR